MITVRLARSLADAEALAPMVADAFKEEDLGIDVYRRWYKKNEKCLIIAYDDSGVPLGYVDYFPLTIKGDAALVMGGSESDLDPDNDFYGPESMDHALVAYLAGIVVVSRGTRMGKDVTAALMVGMMSHMKKYYGSKRMILLGIAYSVGGAKLLSRMGGRVMAAGNDRKDNHDLYRINLTPEAQSEIMETACKRLVNDGLDVIVAV